MPHSTSYASVSDQASVYLSRNRYGTESRSPEEVTIATERYGQAVHDEIGLLHVKIALRLLRENPDRAKVFAVESRNYISELRKTKNSFGKDQLPILKSMMDEIITGRSNKVDVERGIKIVEELSNKKKVASTAAKEGYDRIFKRF